MDAGRWQRLQQLFEGALEVPAGRRFQWLHEACPDDEALRRQAESLIEHDTVTGTSIGEAVRSAAESAARLNEPQPGEPIGPYRLVRLLGRGGMGTVFLAERDDAQFHQTVAVKVVRAGSLTAETLSRFRAERQILAGLDHPNIARLLDGGELANGTPYVVIEHIDGEPITEYCGRRGLVIEDRIRLFQKVCSAVDYAHQRLVVHRDVKPGNILVTPAGEPKLLDFGIAKLLDPAADPSHTQTHSRVMTPDYASPEQVRGEPVTTATDVYALGVLLYELLTGNRPYSAVTTDSFALQQAICVEEPVPPSSFEPRLRGDLESILLKALRKEPARRYASVQQFSEDLQRYLEGYPVRARQDRWPYRAAKFARRNRAGVAASLAFPALLVAAVFAVAMEARRAESERDRAVAARAQEERARRAEQREREQAQQQRERAFAAEQMASREAARAREEAETARHVSTFLAEVFQGTDPFGRTTRPASIRDLVDRGARRLETELRGQPLVRASLQDIIGRVYGNLGDTAKGEPMIRGALATRRARLGGEHPETAASLLSLALVLLRRSEHVEAGSSASEAVRIWRASGGHRGELAEGLETLSVILQLKGEYPAAESSAREALAIRQKLYGGAHSSTGESYNALGALLRSRGEFARAEQMFRKAYQIQTKALGPDHPITGSRANNLATVLFQTGRYAEAEALFRQALGVYRADFGKEHSVVANAINNLATVLFQKRDLDEAEMLFREALALNRKLVGENHSQTADSLNNLGRVLIARRDFGAAEPVMRQAAEVRRKTQGKDHPLVAVALDGLGLIYREKGDFAAAEPLHRESLEIRRRRLRADHPALAVPLLGLAQVHLHFDRAADAEPLLRDALAFRRKALPAGHWETAEIASVLGGCLTVLGRYEEAESLLLASHPVLRKEQGEDSRIARETYHRVIALYRASNQPGKAEAYMRLHGAPPATESAPTPDQ